MALGGLRLGSDTALVKRGWALIGLWLGGGTLLVAGSIGAGITQLYGKYPAACRLAVRYIGVRPFCFGLCPMRCRDNAGGGKTNHLRSEIGISFCGLTLPDNTKSTDE